MVFSKASEVFSTASEVDAAVKRLIETPEVLISGYCLTSGSLRKISHNTNIYIKFRRPQTYFGLCVLIRTYRLELTFR